MKSLYNIAGILPAQCRSNPNDCGISWNSHRRVEPAKREDVIAVDPAEQCSDQTAVATFRMKPIDPKTIKVGDTVRLVGSRTITEWPNCCLDVGEDYKVKAVDRESEDGLTVGFFLTEFSKPFWIYDEDLMLVEWHENHKGRPSVPLFVSESGFEASTMGVEICGNQWKPRPKMERPSWQRYQGTAATILSSGCVSMTIGRGEWWKIKIGRIRGMTGFAGNRIAAGSHQCCRWRGSL